MARTKSQIPKDKGKMCVEAFASTESFLNFKWHRFADNDNVKNIFYLVGTQEKFSMFSISLYINNEGKVKESEYSKVKEINNKPSFLAWVKSAEYKV